MSMGRRPSEQQPGLWVPTADLPQSPGHAFYDKLDQLLKLTERYCVVYQTLKSSPPIEVSMKRA